MSRLTSNTSVVLCVPQVPSAALLPSCPEVIGAVHVSATQARELLGVHRFCESACSQTGSSQTHAAATTQAGLALRHSIVLLPHSAGHLCAHVVERSWPVCGGDETLLKLSGLVQPVPLSRVCDTAWEHIPFAQQRAVVCELAARLRRCQHPTLKRRDVCETMVRLVRTGRCLHHLQPRARGGASPHQHLVSKLQLVLQLQHILLCPASSEELPAGFLLETTVSQSVDQDVAASFWRAPVGRKAAYHVPLCPRQHPTVNGLVWPHRQQ